MGRELYISLGITILASVILFLYFRHRFKVVEHKVNTIFQLVQNHSRPPPMRPSPNLRPRGQYGPPPGIVLEEKRPEEKRLIEVSEDDDSDSGSEDSLTSVSDNEAGPIIISQLGDSNMKDIKIEPASKILLQEPQEIHLDSNSEPGSLSDQSDLSSPAGSSSSPVKSIEPTDYHKLNMVTLKQIAEDRGLQGFKKLRKPALVDLLSK